MKDGFIKVSAGTPDVRVADCEYNAGEIICMVHEMAEKGAMVMVFPELCITGYTCGDLFWQETLLKEAKSQLLRIAAETEDINGLIFVGLPLEYQGKLYNAAAALNRGKIVGFVPKVNIPNYNEFYEGRYFSPGKDVDGKILLKGEDYCGAYAEKDPEIEIHFFGEEDLQDVDARENTEDGLDFEEDDFLDELDMDDADYIDEDDLEDDPEEYEVPVSPNLIFTCPEFPELKVAAESCEDLWVAAPPSNLHAYRGANMIVNLSASDELAGKDTYRRNLVSSQSARLVCGYIYASVGPGESTQDVVYGGHDLIAENGTIFAESRRFENGAVYGIMDIHKLNNERRRMTTCGFASDREREGFREALFYLEKTETKLEQKFDSRPFVPSSETERARRCEEILNIQATGLKKRLDHIHCQNVVIGLSGGLDSTLALLVTVRAFDMLGLSREKITAVTMPCFGTTDRTYSNACELSRCLGAELREVNIREAVSLHFRDIGHDPDKHDVTYENGQARERTQILMDIANQSGGIVIGTGDLSELALGWATYNGDHMSMYGVNSSVPKTLVRHLVKYCADTCEDKKLSGILLDILDTPVSPELLPPEDGVIAQKTEDLVGPYELHDFFLYHMLRWTCPPEKIFRMARVAFEGEYDAETILKWLKIFYRRFFTQQFKRSCLPDGPKVGSVAVSPRGDLRMPSDACGTLWLRQLDRIKI